MLIAGLSEFLIIISIIYALKTLSSPQPFMDTAFRLGLLITLCASALGALSFLTDINVSEFHKIFVFISKHVALTIFIMGAGWVFFNSQPKKIIASVILASSFISLALNLTQDVSMLSTVIMLVAIVFTLYCMSPSYIGFKFLVFATLILLSTLVWGALISNKDLMIGMYHICVAGFYLLATLGFNKKGDV